MNMKNNLVLPWYMDDISSTDSNYLFRKFDKR